MEDKLLVRHKVSVLRRRLGSQERFDSDKHIRNTLLLQGEVNSSNIICIYVSMSDEVDTRMVITELWRKGKTVIVPKAEGGNLHLYTLTSFDELTRGLHGILEPLHPEEEMNKQSIDFFIVPGIAFDRQGYRIGWGKGYYDKLLADITVPIIGLAYDFQVIAEVPHTSYDVPVTMLITEQQIVRVK